MKKTLCWLLVVAMLLAMAPAVFASPNETADTSSMIAGPAGSAENDTSSSVAGGGAENDTSSSVAGGNGAENEGAETPGDSETPGGDSETPGGSENEGSETPANALVNGNNAVELPGGITSVEYTYTAESAGTLTVEFTDVGYISTYSGSYSSQNPDERFNGTNSMAIWFEAYLNGEKLAEGYKGSIDLAAGETATLEWRYVTGTFAANVKQGTVNVSFGTGNDSETPGGGSDDNDTPGSGSENEGNDTPGNEEPAPSTAITGSGTINSDVLYSYTAESAGTLTIDASNGTTPYGPFQGTVYTYSSLILEVDGVAVDGLNQGIYELEVAAGQTVTIQVKAGMAMYQGSTVNLVLTLADNTTEGPGDSETPGGDNDEPTSNTVGLGQTVIDAKTEYTFTAEADGTLTIDLSTGTFEFYGNQSFNGSYYNYGMVLKVNGTAIDSANKGVYEMAVTAGQVVTIMLDCTNANYANVKGNLKLSLEEGTVEPPVEQECEHNYVNGVCDKCGESDPNYVAPDEPAPGAGTGTSSDPYIVGELPYVSTSTADEYYKWTATADGVLTLAKENGLVIISGSSLGSATDEGTNKVLKVLAGDVITINYWGGTGFTLTFEAGAIEIEPGTDAEHPIILEEATIVMNSANSGVYYAWEIAQDGEFIVEILSNTFSYGYTLTVNGQSMGYGTNEQIIQVKAGDLIIAHISVAPSAADTWALTLSGTMSDGSCRHEYVDGVCTKCGEAKEPDGTQDYPFIIGNENATYAYASLPAWFQYTAEEDVTLIIKTDKTKYHSMSSVTVDGASVSTPSKVNEGNYYVYTVEVKAGTVLKFRINALSSAASEMIVEFKQEEAACQHTNTAERQENVVNATCSAGGSYEKVTYCADCQEVISRENVPTEALPHTHAERQENVVEASCSAGGSYDKVTYCSVCKEVISRETIPTEALPHNYVEGTCSGCGAADPNYVAPGCEHNYVDGVCDKCGESDPNYVAPGPGGDNPGTGSMDILAIVLITMMSVVAIVTVSTKKAYKA